MTDLLAKAREMAPFAIEMRRRLHRYPEIGNHLPETRARVLEALDGAPLEINLHEGTSGIVAVLRGAVPVPPSSCGGTWTPCRSPRSPGCRSPANGKG